MVKLCWYTSLHCYLHIGKEKKEARTGETRFEYPRKLLGHNRDSAPRVIVCQGVLFQQLYIELNSLLSGGNKIRAVRTEVKSITSCLQLILTLVRL